MKIPQFLPALADEEYSAIKDCFDSNWFTEGPKTNEFKERLLKLTGAEYGEFAPNGTLAIYLALSGLGIGPGDEVLVPNFTFIASANAVLMTGAIPIFVDIDKNLQINLDLCQQKITNKTKAIMAAHMYGTCGNMDSITEFAKRYKLFVIEDAAQALGVSWNNKHAGTFGDVGTFSFFADKTVTCGEGGFVVTNDKKIAENLVYLRNQGRVNRGTFIHEKIGYNFRITDIQAAIGLVQLGKLDYIKNRKLEIFEKYKERLSGISRFTLFEPMDASTYIPFRVCLIDKEGNAGEVIDVLKNAGVEPRTFFYPMHMQPCFSDLVDAFNHPYKDSSFPVSIKMYESGICLPTFLQITDEQIDYICDIIRKKYVNV
jgi:perosamine synthetase